MASRPSFRAISRRLVKPILPELPKEKTGRITSSWEPPVDSAFRDKNGSLLPGKEVKKPLPAEYCSYVATEAPVQEQLEYATRFFAKSRHSPIHLWTTNLFRKIPESDTPEVVFMGRSNVGKSSMINMLVGDNICYTSATPGRTQTMNAFAVGGRKGGESRVNIIDSPGYGKASRPEWGHELMKYLSKRKQLRRVFLIIESKAGVKTSDREVLSILREYTVPHQILVSKADSFLAGNREGGYKCYSPARLKRFREIVQQIRKEVTPSQRDEGIPPLGDIIACSTKIRIGENHHKIPLGIDALQWAILQAAGLEFLPSQDPSSLLKDGLGDEGNKE